MVKDGIFLGKRYEVLSKIGAGGMADVYKGKDRMLNRYVAIKVLKKEYKEDENFVRKFRSEAQAAAGLMHPNIVNVYDVGEDRGLYYMVMELVEGITLKEYIEKKGRLSHKEVISIAIQVCTGIGVAHAANIIHRDIKPQNIIISKDGKVKVTDFGIAKATTSNTVSSNAMGSVHYTSPEQARGGFSDQRSDIYSIGITLYEMVTGQVPFDGDSTVSVAIKHLQEEITPPSEIVPDIPYSLEQIILKCTQKNSERRYKNTNELIRDLKRSLVDPDGDFVVIPPLRNADTVIITDEDLDDIRSSYDEDDDYDEDDYDEDDYDEDDDDYDEYEDDEYDDEYDSKHGKKGKDSDDVNPRMRKITKILTIVVAIIIIFILVFSIGKA
ncbi:MAG: Stk1 family PASTA domain-containing Ser/Thr kinase, partial [Lachnospiraceae bacterium]|nr:Stk1 family PASTA domain-containing Ser/Thr kinase [Lachnospiraceae bacterium]